MDKNWWTANRGLNILRILRSLELHNFVFLSFVVGAALNLLILLPWIPVVKAVNAGSTIRLINTGDTPTAVDTHIYNMSGVTTNFPKGSIGINAKGTASIALSAGHAGHYSGQSISSPNIATGLVYGPGANQYGKGIDAYPIEEAPSATTYLAILVRNFEGLNTMIRIMNTSEDAQDVDIFFYQSDGIQVSPTAYSKNLPGKATWSVNVKTEGPAIGIGDGFSGSAKISGADTLAVVVQIYNDDDSSAYLAPPSGDVSSAYLASPSAYVATYLYFPWVQKSALDLTAKIYIRNISASSSTLAFSIRKPDGTLATDTEFLTLPASGQSCVDLSTLTKLPDGEYSAEASSDQPMVAVALFENSSNALCAYRPGPTKIGTNLYAPFFRKGEGWSTSISIKNVSTGKASFDYSFRNSEGSILESGSVENLSVYSTVSLAPSIGVFDGACTVVSDVPISGVVLVRNPDGSCFCYPATTEQGSDPLFMPHLIMKGFPLGIFILLL